MFTGLGGEKLWLCPTLNNSAKDLSGNSNNGVIGNSVTTVADTSNGGTLAYNFPDTVGTNTITINGFDLGGLSQLTWSAWIYDESDNAAITHSSFFSWRKGGSGNHDILFFNYERSWLGFQLNNGADGQAAYTPVYYQNWKHYCVVFDGTNPTATDRLNLYVNGVLQTPDTTFSYPATTSNETGSPYAEIGDYVGNPNHGIFNFKGKQDDIRIYERAITQAEIAHLASSRGVQGGPYYKPLTLKSRVTRLLSNRAATLLERIRSASKPTTPISIKVKHNEEPSYKAGYAKNAGESENPHLWDGLVGAWVPSLGVTGETLRDVSGNGNHGEFQGDTSWRTNQKETSIFLDGNDDFISGLGNVSLSNSEPFSVIAKVKLIDYADYYPTIFQIKTNTSYSISMFLSQQGGYQGLNFGAATGWVRRRTGSTIPVNETNLFCVTYNGKGALSESNFSFYQNGIEKTTVSSSAFNGTSQDNYIGTTNNSSRIYDDFYGHINLASIYNRALSPQEIQELYVDSLAPFRRKKSPIGYQPNKELKGLIRT